MKMLKCTQKLRSVETTSSLIEFPFPLEMIKQLAAIDFKNGQSRESAFFMRLTERHAEVEFVRRLERELEWYNERVVDQGQNSPLSKNMSDLSRSLRDVRLADGLQRIYPLGILLPHLHDFSEATLSDDLEEVEGFDGQGFASKGSEIDLEVE